MKDIEAGGRDAEVNRDAERHRTSARGLAGAWECTGGCVATREVGDRPAGAGRANRGKATLAGGCTAATGGLVLLDDGDR